MSPAQQRDHAPAAFLSFPQDLLPGLRPVRRHDRFAAVRTEDNIEIESGKDRKHGQHP